MIKFKVATRYDVKLGKEGLWKPVSEEFRDERDVVIETVYYATFKVAVWDNQNPTWKWQNERYQRVHKQEIAQLKSDEEKLVHRFVHLCLLDWKDIVDEKGKAVPFSKEAAIEFFSSETDGGPQIYIFNKLFAFASDVSNYRVSGADHDDPIADVEDVVKN